MSNNLYIAPDLAATNALITTVDTVVDANAVSIGALNDISAANVNTEVDNALNTAIPGSPTSGSINDVIKDVEDRNTGVPIVSSPTNDILISNDTEKSTNAAAYELQKTILCGVAGVLRVKFDLRSSSVNIAYGKIYKNGAGYGTERTDITQAYVTFSEDLTFDIGDTIELRAYHQANLAYIRNFRIYGVLNQQFYNELT